jgi:protein-S-isoprenylcysteine O-methyltransferase Ste14
MYVAMGLIQAGLALMFANAWLLLVRYGAIAREERYLERKFSGAYLEY